LVGESYTVCATRLLAWLRRNGRKGKEKNGEKMAVVGVEPTPSAIRAVVISQLD
jgi:hypothetical protein